MASLTKKEPKPEHVAIIMDGNGRWAKEKGLPHLKGHEKGADAVRRSIEAAKDFGIKYLTLYAFSTENWKRPKSEVIGLMNLLKVFIDKNLDEINSRGIRVRAIGRTEKLPSATLERLNHAIEITKGNKEGTVIMALNYGGRAEIVDAAKAFATAVSKGLKSPDSLSEQLFSKYLYAPDVPDPDLLIRTSGEFRLSNFLMWELAYTEIYISKLLWPDFNKEEFKKAIESFQNRNRRFGGR
ncbi:MAG: di-trans,poly-cis-decaprenylcistransferase [Lentisphaerae bacterium GWF2_52_8]|nr:MAG: di-trans,poly-cis-decaprenylcistransferase [Lentisphaerae bacterium GWF2_52_8]